MEQITGMPPNMMKVMKKMQDALKHIAQQTEPVLVNFKGKIFMPGFSKENVEYVMKEWQMPEDSVIIASYPKTGTAWCIEIVRQILYGNDDVILKKSKMIPSPMHLLEIGPKEKFGMFPHLPMSRKFFATHIAADLFNFDNLEKSKSKVIYMYRNPKDQAVSWYHFTKKIPNMSPEQKDVLLGREWDEFFAKYVAGDHPTGVGEGEWYPDHLVGWMEQAGKRDDILLVEYESLKRDFAKETRRMASFLGVEMGDSDVKRVAERCTVSAMKSDAASDKTGFLKMNVRKGEVGGWKDQLTVSQSELIDGLIDEKLADKGINFTYVL